MALSSIQNFWLCLMPIQSDSHAWHLIFFWTRSSSVLFTELLLVITSVGLDTWSVREVMLSFSSRLIMLGPNLKDWNGHSFRQQYGPFCTLRVSCIITETNKNKKRHICIHVCRMMVVYFAKLPIIQILIWVYRCSHSIKQEKWHFRFHVDQLAQLLQEIKVLRPTSKIVRVFIWKLGVPLFQDYFDISSFVWLRDKNMRTGKYCYHGKRWVDKVPEIVWEKVREVWEGNMKAYSSPFPFSFLSP